MTPRSTTRRPLSRSAMRRLIGALAGVVAITVTVGTSIQAAPTDASWLDAEWDSAAVGTLDCGPGGSPFTTRASGKLLGGSLAGINLDDLAELDGISGVNDESGVAITPPPPQSNSLGDNAYANPLTVTALDTLQVSLGDLLLLPLNADLGVDNSYVRVNADGTSTGATGAVSNSGAIQTTASQPGPNPPTFATLQLKNIVQSALGQDLSTAIAGLADASLEVGAVASNATLDACAATWTGSILSSLQRQYAVAGVDLDLTSPTVGTLVTGTTGVINGLDGSVEALAGNAGVLSSLTTGISGLVNTVLTTAGLGLGSVTINNLAVNIDLTQVNGLLDDTISDNAGIVSIDLLTGQISIDLDGLLGAAYGTSGINGLPANTQLLINDDIINALTAATTEALVNWVDDLESEIRDALESLTLSAQVVVNVLQGAGPPAASVTLSIPEVSLQGLIDGDPVVTTSVSLAGGASCTVLTLVLCTALNTVGTLLAPTISASLGAALDAALFTSATNVLATTRAALLALTDPVITLVANATRGLFGEDSLLSLTANAQNSPDPANGNPEPAWSVPGPDPATGSTGQYDVAALRLTAVGTTVQLDLARSSVGTSAPR
ncbi:choice-of-anchor G family protein [Agreia bicolorata]|nr:choice-of-anchor G family protein [Agreia bicolorata]